MRRKTNKEPGTSAGLLLFNDCLRSELVAQAAPDDIDRLLDVVESVERRLTEVVVQIFGSQEHMVDKLVFKPRARHPTELIDGDRGAGRIGKACMAPTRARSAVGEQVREEDVAEPRTHGGQLVGLFFDAKDRLLDVGAVE